MRPTPDLLGQTCDQLTLPPPTHSSQQSHRKALHLERMATIARSREGWQWTPDGGLQAGLPSIGVIEPSQMIKSSIEVFDVIVVGAGYTGLTAARDLATSGS